MVSPLKIILYLIFLLVPPFKLLCLSCSYSFFLFDYILALPHFRILSFLLPLFLISPPFEHILPFFPLSSSTPLPTSLLHFYLHYLPLFLPPSLLYPSFFTGSSFKLFLSFTLLCIFLILSLKKKQDFHIKSCLLTYLFTNLSINLPTQQATYHPSIQLYFTVF